MNPSFVVNVQLDEDGLLRAYLPEADPDFPDRMISRRIVIEPPDLPGMDTRENAISYGRRIEGALRRHPAIADAISAVYMAKRLEPARLMFNIQTPAAECYRWETLCNDSEKFAAIDGECRVARIPGNWGSQRDPPLAFSWPLRMAAFLSPADISAAEELDKILSTVAEARGKGLALECTIYLGEQALLDRLEAEIQGGLKRVTGISVRPIPDTPEKFEAVLAKNPPHILHFFCHGVARAGTQNLEFATINDWDNDLQRGSSLLSIDRLLLLQARRKCWLIVLNCCQGAEAVEQTYSMAYKLVVDGGYPMAVGMNEPIEASDATAFSAAFYKSLFEIIRLKVKRAQAAELDFIPAIAAVRRSLYELHAEQPPDAFGRWSLPILYVSGRGLTVLRIEVDAEMQTRIDLVVKFLREMPADTPEGLREDALAQLDRPPAVHPSLRPDLFGNFA